MFIVMILEVVMVMILEGWYFLVFLFVLLDNFCFLIICLFLVLVDLFLLLEEVIGFIVIDDILVDVMLNLGREFLFEFDLFLLFLFLEEVVFCILFDGILMDFVFKLGIRLGLSLIYLC